MLWELGSNFNHISVRGFVLNGTPFEPSSANPELTRFGTQKRPFRALRLPIQIAASLAAIERMSDCASLSERDRKSTAGSIRIEPDA